MKKTIQLISAIVVIVFYSYSNQVFSQNSIIISDSDTTVFSEVEEIPSFSGGDEARMNFLMKNLKYPQKAREEGIEGTVYITFVVEKDGSLTNIKTIRGIGGGCDEEAIRVIKLMPKWTPGKQKAENVRVRYNMALKFSF